MLNSYIYEKGQTYRLQTFLLTAHSISKTKKNNKGDNLLQWKFLYPEFSPMYMIRSN